MLQRRHRNLTEETDLRPITFLVGGWLDVAAAVLLEMGNPSRFLILDFLSDGEMSVGKLADKVGLSQSATSQHLRRLSAAGLVDSRRDAQKKYYFCRSMAVVTLLDAVKGLPSVRDA